MPQRALFAADSAYEPLRRSEFPVLDKIVERLFGQVAPKNQVSAQRENICRPCLFVVLVRWQQQPGIRFGMFKDKAFRFNAVSRLEPKVGQQFA